MKSAFRIAAAAAFFLLAAPAFAVLAQGAKFVPFALKNVDGKDYAVTMEDGKLTLTVTEAAGAEPRVSKTHPAGVLIDFWATWCVPCRKAMPHMQRLSATYGPADGQTSGGLRVFGIAVDDAGGKVVKPFYQKLKITYPMLADPPSGPMPEVSVRTAKDAKRAYDVYELPVVYLVDSSGTITHVHVGFKEEHIAELDKAVSALLPGGRR